MHKTDGIPHPQFSLYRVEDYRKALLSGDFVRLCYSCHKGVHWAMKYLGYTWARILGSRGSG